MTPLIVFAFFLYGMVTGSFVNVCIYRLPLHISIAKGRSFCPCCHHQLSAWDLIPVLSWLYLGGHCRYCRQSISPRYPVIELLTGALFAGSYLRFGLSAQAILFCCILAALVVISGIDWATQEIPDVLNILLALCGIIAILQSGRSLSDALLSLIIVSGPLFIIALITDGGIGGGDIKLMAAMGLCLGSLQVVLAFFIGCISAAIFSVILLSTQKLSRRSMIPLSPFLAFGCSIAIYWGPQLISWYLRFF